MKNKHKTTASFIRLLFAFVLLIGCTAPVNDNKGKVTSATQTAINLDKANSTSQIDPAPSKSGIQIVKARSTGSEKYVDWGTKPIEPEDAPPDTWTWTHMMCNGPSRDKIKASSTLASQGKIDYLVSNICDDDPTTAWVEGQSDYGIGEYLEMNWKPMGDGEISLLNGYQADKSTWENNSRVKKMKVSVGEKEVCIIALADVMGIQKFKIPGWVTKNKNEYEYTIDGPIRFTILEVYPGLKWKDTAISGIFSCGG